MVIQYRQKVTLSPKQKVLQKSLQMHEDELKSLGKSALLAVDVND